MAGSLNPTSVRATRVDGGFRFSGKGTVVSGCTHASWMVAAGLVVENGTPQFVDGAPVVKVGVLPMDACRIQETWRVTGMRGTGSHDVEFNDVFVPDDLTFAQADALANLGASLAPVSLGIARHAIDAFIELAGAKCRLERARCCATASPRRRNWDRRKDCCKRDAVCSTRRPARRKRDALRGARPPIRNARGCGSVR